jgi:hypothetical protein
MEEIVLNVVMDDKKKKKDKKKQIDRLADE